MALTRKALKAMGLTEEQVDSIVEMHTEVTDDLKTKLKEAKEKAENYDKVKKQLDEINDGDDYRQKYDDEHEAFEQFKSEVENEKAFEKKKAVFTEIAKKAKVSEKRINSIIRLEKEYINGLELDKDGKVADSDSVEKFIKENYDEYIVTSTKVGAATETPPNNTGGKMTKEEILKIKDTAARQKAIAENAELFGI